MSGFSAPFDWDLVHKLNGQLLTECKRLLGETIGWNPKRWICNVIVLERSLERTAETVFYTSATIFEGHLYDSVKKLQGSWDQGVWELQRLVPLVGSFSSYCVQTGNIVWIDNVKSVKDTPRHPLFAHYRNWQDVSVNTGDEIQAEYVFPIRTRTGLGETLLGVLNAECYDSENEFKEAGFHELMALIIPLVDVHGAFLVVANVLGAKPQEAVFEGLVSTHQIALRSKVEDLIYERNKAKAATDRH